MNINDGTKIVDFVKKKGITGESSFTDSVRKKILTRLSQILWNHFKTNPKKLIHLEILQYKKNWFTKIDASYILQI